MGIVGRVDGKVAAHAVDARIDRCFMFLFAITVLAVSIPVLAVIAVISRISMVSNDSSFFIRRSFAIGRMTSVGVDVVGG